MGNNLGLLQFDALHPFWNSGKKYHVIYADPPWYFKTWSPKGSDQKSAIAQYPCMTFDELKKMPIGKISEDNSILFMWATDPLLPKQIEIMEFWGFRYRTVGFVWVKTNKRSMTPFIGLGYYTRSNPEYLLIGVKGSVGRPKNKSLSEILHSPVREHSRKPDIIREYIMDMYDGPYVELFARETIDGWDSFGNDSEKFNKSVLFD